MLAICLLSAFSPGRANAATSRRGPLANKPWLRPFQWKNSEEQSEQKSPPKLPPKQGYGLSGLNIFRWTNDVSSDKKTPQSPPATKSERTLAKTAMPSQPPDTMSAAIATDGPVQPNSVLSASLEAHANQTLTEKQIAYERSSIDWPVTSDPVSPQDQPTSQGVNPFGWSNSAPRTDEQMLPPKSTIASEELSSANVAIREPWNWSNDPRGKEKPQPITPPDQPSFNEAVRDALSWAEDPPEAEAQMIDRSSPPADATDDEVIEWEKQAYPWIRPFYWADEDKYEIPFEEDFELEDPSASPEYVPLLARPFKWTDTKKSGSRKSKPVVAPDVSRSTRTVAFQQDDENMPKPLPSIESTEDVNSESVDLGLQELNDDSQSEFDAEDKGAIADAETLGKEPVDNSLQFLRADTVLLEPGEFQYDYGMTYSKFDITLPVLVNIDPNTVGVEHAEFRLREVRVPLEVRYGLARRIQLFLNVPFGWVNSEFSFPGFDEFDNNGGLGDIVFGATFLLRDGTQGKSDAILTIATVAPTGDDPFTPVGLSPSSPTLGSGTWSIGSNLLLVRNYDPLVVFYGAGTRQHFLSTFEGVNFRPGGEYNYQFGMGFAVNDQVTLSTRFNGAYVSELRLDGRRVQGSIQEPMTLGLAMTISKNKKLIEPFVDFGLTDDSTDARIGITWTR